MHRHLLGRIDPEPDLTAFDAQHRHGDLIADHEGFTNTSRQDQHGRVSPGIVG
jgi:hypothetical protein